MIRYFPISILADVAHTHAKRTEKAIGYSLELPKNSGWIPATQRSTMTGIWKAEGISAKCVNYFSMGHIRNGISSHFDPVSPFFQAWLGGYIVQFSGKSAWSIQKHYAIVERDQKTWLRAYGNRSPHVSIDQESVKEIGPITVSGFKGTLFTGGMWSDCDIGGGNNRMFAKAIGQFEASMFAKEAPGQHFLPENFQPKIDDTFLLLPYQKMYLQGYGGVFPVTALATVVLYANGVAFTDIHGNKHNTFAHIRRELLQALSQIKIRTLTK